MGRPRQRVVLLGTAHHYYFVGVPSYWLPIGGFFSALEPLVFVAMSVYAYRAMRRSGLAHPNTLAVHWTLGSALFSALGAAVVLLIASVRTRTTSPTAVPEPV